MTVFYIYTYNIYYIIHILYAYTYVIIYIIYIIFQIITVLYYTIIYVGCILYVCSIITFSKKITVKLLDLNKLFFFDKKKIMIYSILMFQHENSAWSLASYPRVHGVFYTSWLFNIRTLLKCFWL